MNNKDNDALQAPSTGAKPRLGTFRVMQSILAGALGVQSKKRHQEDFESASPWAYIFGGLIFGILFIAGLILLVNVVLASTQA